MDPSTRLGLWPLRVLWLLVAVTVAVAGGEALADRSGAVRATVSALAWAGWTATLVAMLVPRTLGLTVVRLAVPGGLVAAVASAAAETSALSVAGVVLACAAVLAAFAPWTTDAFVDGSSYGAERRVALRTPAVIAAVAAATGAAVLAGAATGPVLAAAGRPVAGLGATGVGWAVAVAGARAVHQLSRRWLVLVPTGMVLHDPLTMPEPQLFLRQTMAHLGPASGELDDDTEDLTAGASGLAVELVLDEAVDLLVSRGRHEAETRPVHRVLFTPGRPAALFEAARANRLPVG